MSTVGSTEAEPVPYGGVALAAGSSVERALVERARRGDHDAFTALVERRLAPTFRTVLAVMGNEADARDVTQSIFVRVWTGLPGLTDPDRFAAWFGRILVNTCRTSMRGRRQRIVREIALSGLPDAGESLADGSPGADAETAAADRLDRAIDRVSVAERTILALHHHDGLSLLELSERLGVPPKTCKSRLFTARRALERALAAEDA